jgi:hypothetical protein
MIIIKFVAKVTTFFRPLFRSWGALGGKSLALCVALDYIGL